MKQQEQLHADKELLMCVTKEVVNETKEGLGRDEECRIPLEGFQTFCIWFFAVKFTLGLKKVVVNRDEKCLKVLNPWSVNHCRQNQAA